MSSNVDSSHAEDDAEVMTAQGAPDEAAQLAEQLRFERLIKIFVGGATKPYLVQQTILEHASPFFVKAIKNEHFGGEENIGVLRFPEDDLEVWKMLLFYIIKGELPESMRTAAHTPPAENVTTEDYQKLYALVMMCCATGDRYFMSDFQADLLDFLQEYLNAAVGSCSELGYLSWDNIKLAFKITPPASELRRLVAEHIMYRFYGPAHMRNMRPEPLRDEESMLACLDGIPGAITDILRARDWYRTGRPARNRENVLKKCCGTPKA